MEWETVTAEQFCTWVTDGTHDSPKRQEKGRYLITSKHLSETAIDFSSAYKISEEDYQKIIIRSNVEQYDILFSMIGTIGNVYREANPMINYAVKNMAIFKFNGNKENSYWFYYWLKSPQAKAYISQMQAGSTQGYLTLATLRNFPVSVPDEITKNKIVAILSSLDDKIENNNRINRNLEAQAQALFKSWFVDFEPFGGTMPEDWKEYELGEFLPVITGKKDANIASKKGTYPFFSCAQDILYTENYSFNADAILVAGNGDFNVKWYRGKFEAYQRTYVLIPNDSMYLGWLYYMVKHNLNNITCGARGSVIKFITKGNLENFRFAAPKDLTKCDIIDKFNTINNTIESKKAENQRLAQLRDTLLPKLMKGEIEV